MSLQNNSKKSCILCNICREKLTKKNHIKCPLCKHFFCIQCVESWLLTVKNNMICPLCAKKWDEIFVCHYLPLNFVVNELKLTIHGSYVYDYEYEIDGHQEGGTDKKYFDTIDDNIDEETFKLIKSFLLRNIIG